jgi:hyaluronoglucosaminidase
MSEARVSASPFSTRGVVEGFYGRPWSHEQRLDLIDFLAERGMNTFVYAPKDDASLRREWRSPSDGEALARLGELVVRCRSRGMDLVWCLAPGLSIRYSDRADRAIVLARLVAATELGVRRVGLLLDDIPMELQHPEDLAAYTDLASAHVALVREVFAGLPAGVRLIVCPTVYRGTGSEPYITELGGALDPRIDLFWTGRAICSATLDVADAAAFTRAANRPPTYWDNYPVNDVAMGNELHIGPYRGRDPQLWRFASGIIANGMELAEASRIPFATIADYLGDPEGYDPEASWRRAMRDVVGDQDVEAFAVFADNVRSSCLAVDDAPIVSRSLGIGLFRLEQGDAQGAAAELGSLAQRLGDAAAHLLRGPVANRPLIDEIRPWLEAFELGAQAVRRLTELIVTGRLATDGPSELRPFLIGLRRARVRVFGDALEMTLSDLTGTHFRPGEVP